MLHQGKKTGLLVEDQAAAPKEEVCLQNCAISQDAVDHLLLMIADLSRVNHHLETDLQVGEQKAGQRREKEENQKGGGFPHPERELEMISSLDVRDQKMPAHLGGPHPEEDPDLPLGEDLVHLFAVAGLQEGVVDLLGGETEVDEVDLVLGEDPGHGVAIDGGVGAK